VGCAFQPRCHYAHATCAQLPPLLPADRQESACWLVREQADWPKLRPAA
jgi:ABC-type antimicrobial peptide transport system ATPase subunit